MIWKSLGVNDRRIQNGIVPPAIIRPVMYISEPLVAPPVRKLLRSELKFRIYLEELTGITARPKCGFRRSELSRTMTDSLTTFSRGVTESGRSFRHFSTRPKCFQSQANFFRSGEREPLKRFGIECNSETWLIGRRHE